MVSTFLTAAAALTFIAQAATSTVVPPGAIVVPQWSTYEITLTSTAVHDTASSIDLTGVFNGPGGQSVEIKGFWDGGSTFRIRFTPTTQGLWTFMTVADDPGLDGRLGNIAVVPAAQGAHGFVRQVANDSGDWEYDDETSAAKEVTAVPILALNLDKLREVDGLVSDARTAGRIAGLVLFNTDDDTSPNMSETGLYRYVQYMTARYGAYPNVVWCLHPSTATTAQDKFWGVAAEMTAGLDPYFAAADDEHARVLLETCTPAPAAPSETSTSAGVRFGDAPIDAHIVLASLASQTGPNPGQTSAVEGIVRQSDKAAGTVIVRAADGVEHVVHVTKDTMMHGGKSAEGGVFEGLEEGSHVVIHYAGDGGEKTAMEVDRVGDNGLEIMEARVTHIDRAKKELTVKLPDGSKQTLRLTDRAAREADEAATEASSVMVYYTNDAGDRIVHFFKRVK